MFELAPLARCHSTPAARAAAHLAAAFAGGSSGNRDAGGSLAGKESFTASSIAAEPLSLASRLDTFRCRIRLHCSDIPSRNEPSPVTADFTPQYPAYDRANKAAPANPLSTRPSELPRRPAITSRDNPTAAEIPRSVPDKFPFGRAISKLPCWWMTGLRRNARAQKAALQSCLLGLAG